MYYYNPYIPLVTIVVYLLETPYISYHMYYPEYIISYLEI